MAATPKLTHEAIGAEVRGGTYVVVVAGRPAGPVEMNDTVEIPVESLTLIPLRGTIDSTGIAVIVQAQQERGQNGGGLVVHSASDQVLRVLELTGLTENGLVAPSQEAALAAVGLQP